MAIKKEREKKREEERTTNRTIEANISTTERRTTTLVSPLLLFTSTYFLVSFSLFWWNLWRRNGHHWYSREDARHLQRPRYWKEKKLAWFLRYYVETLLKDTEDLKKQIRSLEEERTQLKTKLYYMNLEIHKKDRQMEDIVKSSKITNVGMKPAGDALVRTSFRFLDSPLPSYYTKQAGGQP